MSGHPGTNIVDAENSLSRALYVLSTAVWTAGQWAAAGAAGTYAAVVIAERSERLPPRLQIRGMRWMAPLFTGIVGGFIGTRVGLYAGIDGLNARVTLARQAASNTAQQQQLDGLQPIAPVPAATDAPAPTDAEEVREPKMRKRFSHRERDREKPMAS
mmetsp:Transcript_19206/g.50477  ORF Transcript_19206/g.50477 Transcript_19206/m.50477 type:complete len:158 (-) Transcript_19206:283-756(-)|eukprot:2516072-Prymnesium_polylepis.1